MTYRGPIEDRIAIRELIEAYSDAVCRKDMAAWSETWMEDAVWGSRDGPVTGRAAITERCSRVLDGLPYLQFRAIPGAIEVEGDVAVARTYIHTTRKTARGELQLFEATYADRLVKSNGAWRFDRRE